jgi:hypothetical protein
MCEVCKADAWDALYRETETIQSASGFAWRYLMDKTLERQSPDNDSQIGNHGVSD